MITKASASIKNQRKSRFLIFQLILLFLLFLLFTFSIILIGIMLSNAASIEKFSVSVALQICIFISSVFWIVCVRKSGFFNAILTIFVGLFFIAVLLAVIVNLLDSNDRLVDFIVNALVISTVSLCLNILASIVIGFQMFVISMSVQEKWFKKSFLLCYTFIALVTLALFFRMTSKAIYLPSLLIENILVCLFILDGWQRAKNHILNQAFPLLKSWAIALCTFGNTSFYNKDLSHVDFTNIDLANIDLRAQNFYRTCFRGATGLDRSRLDNRYFDIDNPKVQQLLTQGTTIDRDLNGLNLQGAYLKDGEMSEMSLIHVNLSGSDLRNSTLCNTNLLRANLSGADLQAANLHNCILVQTDLTGANLTEANLTGACIENWNINGRTNFTDVQCDYIYRKLDDTGNPTDRYPLDRNFEPGEFASLYQEVENVVELIFKEGINWRAFAFSLQKLQIDDEGLGLQLRGIEQRGDFWVVKVTHDQNVPSAVVEQKLGAAYETLQLALCAKEQQINQLLGIVTNQSEAIKELSKKPFGNQFNIAGSTITNLAGSGQIDYTEAANQVRNLVATPSNPSKSNQIAQLLLTQIQQQQLLAPTDREKAELICQIILTESEKDPFFKQFILQQSANLLTAIPEGPIAIAFQTALEILNP